MNHGAVLSNGRWRDSSTAVTGVGDFAGAGSIPAGSTIYVHSYDIPKLKAGDDCPKCAGELVAVKHRYQDSGGHPDCDWLACLDCNFQTDPE